MKHIFISQPMKDKTAEEFFAVRAKAIDAVRKRLEYKEDIHVLDTFFEDDPLQDVPPDGRGLYFLGKSLEYLSTADIAYFAKGWESARGCRIEHTCAVEYGIDIIMEEQDEK